MPQRGTALAQGLPGVRAPRTACSLILYPASTPSIRRSSSVAEGEVVQRGDVVLDLR